MGCERPVQAGAFKDNSVSLPFLDTESQQPNGAEKPGKRQLHKLSWKKRNDKVTGSLQIQGESGAGGKTDLGELPSMAVGLLAGLGVIWVMILLYLMREHLKKKTKKDG